MQHVAVWSDDVDAQLEQLITEGVDYVLAQRHFGTHAYLDMPSHPGMMVQLMPKIPRYIDLFDQATQAADQWDGKSNPWRVLSWD